ncbi:succinate dehydrogenase, hydrophobic membrane anchor protein [Sphingomonas sp. ASV193]|uniref:succinate dehydrogenase, hydrophobic membrane anchor protein n=1 Tax=Sphingomonas sp. ASV193 TaxID=3144405 RepID=UPI0032E87472
MSDSATPLGKVRGLGSAHAGGEHWLAERFSSVALLLLGLWLVFSLVMLPDLTQQTLVSWLKQPLAAVPMALFVIAAFAHGLDGLKVVIDDYVHDEGTRIGLGFALTMIAIFGAGLALFALAKIAFGAAA